MKMIEVLIKLANGEIEDKSTLLVENEQGETFKYVYYERYHVFRGKCCSTLEDDFGIDKDSLNFEVELIPPKPKEYLVKLNVQGLYEGFAYLNYFRNQVRIHDEFDNEIYKTHFTKDELQSIQPVKEFLDDMQGKYELIEVEENESMDS